MPKWLGASAIGALVLTPLLGLVFAVADRSADPLTGATPPLFQLSAGVGELLLRSILLSVWAPGCWARGWLGWNTEPEFWAPGRW